MAITPIDTPPLDLGDRVVAVEDLRDVPEGTAGRIRVVNGITWLRYWVEFDNGVWLGSVGADKVTAERAWPTYKQRRAEAEAEAAARAAEEAARPPAEETPAAASDGGAEGGAASRVPAHLLERSRAAREKAKGGA